MSQPRLELVLTWVSCLSRAPCWSRPTNCKKAFVFLLDPENQEVFLEAALALVLSDDDLSEFGPISTRVGGLAYDRAVPARHSDV